ncbi:hypothetical protein BSK46_14270 [Paenibacillus odorifer]|uniref:hypothetical protein n=1 Tax=Paenibacillus TaxID=44249 RepID=UPI00096C0FFB|nr:hypothetical protein [Paenibacillus odorifer]OME37891.1 hypothetical protein BSK46_14270 [Paenibacillus odorifer]
MSDFVQKVEKYIADRKDREQAEQDKIKAIKEKKAKIHATLLEVMYDLFNNSPLETNYKNLLRLTADTDSYYIEIDTITFLVHRSVIENKIDSNPKLDLKKLIEQELFNELENSDLPF